MRRQVAYTEVAKGNLSTVFVGYNMNLFGPYPICFETMAFFEFEPEEQYQMRYATWKEAEEGHNRIVRLLQGKGYEIDINKFL